MIPASFKESSDSLGPPDGMSEEDVGSLSIARIVDSDGNISVVSCWKLTPEELREVFNTGRVWLLVRGLTMPPVAVVAESPFA